MLAFERQAWEAGYGRLAGVDEAGRGPLAGPVVAAAVVFERALLEREAQESLAGLTDSKQLTEAQRDEFFRRLTGVPGIDIGLGICESDLIDRINILEATRCAMVQALGRLAPPPDHALVDGNPMAGLPCSTTAIIGGDGRSLSIAAASVVAKVTRDRIMKEFEGLYPGYGFGRHKGYGTRMHTQALLELGPTPIHRLSFRPVRDAIRIRAWMAAHPATEGDGPR